MRYILIISLLLCMGTVSAQSERSDDYVTYDSTMQEKAQGEGPFTWHFSISWHRGDTTHRPTLWFYPGAGEFGTDTTKLSLYLWHYWIKQGYSGAVVLGNGTHYPMAITLLPPAGSMRPWHIRAVVDSLRKYYPILAGSQHFCALSQGNQAYQDMLMFYPTPGDESGMAQMRSMVDLQGEAGEQFSPFITGPADPTAFGHWAKKYDGRFFGIEGSNDTRNIWQQTQNIGDSTGTDGYFAFDTLSNGSHCCWNAMTDPSVTNWTNTVPVNHIVIHTTGAQASTMGNYVYDATHGTNIFQWMLRQGDTSLKVGCTPTVTGIPSQTKTLPVSSATVSATVTLNCGHVGYTASWVRTSGPNTPTIVSPTSISTNITGLIAGTYIFTMTATDTSGLTGSASDTVVVNPLPVDPNSQQLYVGEYVTPWIDSAGNARTLTSNLSLAGTGGTGTPGLPGLISTPGYTFRILNNLLHGTLFGAVQDSSIFVSGGNDQGQCALGNFTTPVLSLTRVTADSAGNPVTGISILQGFYVNNTSEGFYAVKRGAVTDTILGAGDLEYGMAMNGTAGGIATRLFPLYWRTGHHVAKMAASKAYAILWDDGLVETGGANGIFSFLGYAGTGTQYRTPHAVTFPGSMTMVDLVGGDIGGFLCKGTDGHLYGFGPHSIYFGTATDGVYATPQDLNTNITSFILNGTTRTSISSIAANSDCFHYIANDSTLWGNGDNGSGGIGNGVEANMISPPAPSTPYSIDPAQIAVLMQIHPTQVTAAHDYIKIFSGCLFGKGFLALRRGGKIMASGRNKGAVLGNGVVECIGANGDISATYANSWDLPFLTPITPYSLVANIPASCPGCKTGVVITFCSECTIPTTTPTANAGSNQSLAGVVTSTSLDGSASTCTGGKLTYYKWTQVSGAAATIDVPAAIKPNITGLLPGIYTFNLLVTDNGFNTSNQNVTVTVGAAAGVNYFIGRKGKRKIFKNG